MAWMDQDKMINAIQMLDQIADGSSKEVNRGFATVVAAVGDRKVIENAAELKGSFSDAIAERYLVARGLQQSAQTLGQKRS